MSITADHLDYLQRLTAPPEVPVGVSATSAPAGRRRLDQIQGIAQEPRSQNDHADQIRFPSEDVLIGLYGHKIPFAFLLEGQAGLISISAGTWSAVERESLQSDALDTRQDLLRALIGGSYSAADLTLRSPSTRRWPRGGIALGAPSLKVTEFAGTLMPMDRLIRTMAGAEFAVLALAEPVDETAVSKFRSQVIREMRGVASAVRREVAPSPLAEHYLELLRHLLEGFTQAEAAGAWRVAIYLLGDSASYYRLATAWRSVFASEEALVDPVRTWSLDAAADLAVAWALPDYPAAQSPGGYDHPLAFQTILSSRQLATYCHLPNVEAPGFRVRSIARFDAVPAQQESPSPLTLGYVDHEGREATPYTIDPAHLTRHVFVTGATGSGKTNTVRHFLAQSATRGIPFLVIEPAKTEYARLGGDVRVLSLGGTDSSFRLNPFEVPAGISIGVHIDLLRSVFAASFGMFTPLPQILERCLYAVYEDRGWDLNTDLNSRLDDGSDRADAFPTLTDLARKVEDVVPSLGWVKETSEHFTTALLTRLNSLRTGGKGRMLDTQASLDMNRLLGRAAVLELEAIGDDDDKAFLMGLLMIRLVEHRRSEEKATHSEHLKHLLVIEEAHRLLTNVPAGRDETQGNPRGKAVEAFTNLLSEIRAYGQGVVVADQVPARLAPDVIKNTNLKIVHKIVAGDDRAILAAAMVMDEPQARALATLGRDDESAEAVVFGEGDDRPLLVRIPKAETSDSEEFESSEGLTVVLSHDSGEGMRVHRGDEGCEVGCRGGIETCGIAQKIARTGGVERAVARIALSAMEDTTAPDRLWPELVAEINAARPPRIDGDELVTAVVIHAVQVLSSRRGSQGRWTYSETAEFRASLQRMLLETARGANDRTAHAAFRDLSASLHIRRYDPYPGCERICKDEPPRCLYRHAARDLIVSGVSQEVWNAAETSDSGTGMTRARWDACLAAALRLREDVPPDASPASRKAAEEAIRRAGLCFGQQSAHANTRRMHWVANRDVGWLIEEAATWTSS